MHINKNTRINQVMQEVQSKINSRFYASGARLPSIRAQAKSLNVSISTVVEAYERLTAQGLINPKPGSGFYVSRSATPLLITPINPLVDREIDPLWISRQALNADPSVLKPGCGWLPSSWLYEQGIKRALRKQARSHSANLTDYATPMGHPALRQLLLQRLINTGIDATTEQIILTESGTNAIDLICRFFLESGDTVLVDDPCYFNFHALLTAHQVQIVGIPYTHSGPDLLKFKQALDQYSPRLYITNSGIHNPTGATLSAVTAHRLLKLVESSKLIIVEDDIFSDLELTSAPRLAAFDGLERVIQIGSFSKTISAAVRCGYIIAKPNWIEALTDLKIATTFGGGGLATDLLFTALTDGGYRRHMESIQQRLADNMDNIIRQLEKIDIHPWLIPEAGMFLWCKLPKGKDAATLARASLQDGVILAPGNAFSQSRNAHDFMRFNIAQSNHQKIFDILAKLLNNKNLN